MEIVAQPPRGCHPSCTPDLASAYKAPLRLHRILEEVCEAFKGLAGLESPLLIVDEKEIKGEETGQSWILPL